MTLKISGECESEVKVLVTGGTGAMGGYLVKILSEAGNTVDVTTRKNRESSAENVRYIHGDAHDTGFIRNILDAGSYDVFIDFMSYTTEEFRKRAEIMTGGTGHYMFLSSARVYAKSDVPIKETSPRLLDVCTDKEYLATDEYALAKAREENILLEGKAGNFTIIRPYITYSSERLQLGVYEKESWLYRAMHGRPVVFSRDIAGKYTTMTWGCDVAGAIACLAGRRESFGQAYHITADDSMKWSGIAEIYREVFADVTGREMEIVYIGQAFENTAQWKYDRLYDRRFDNSKIKEAVKDFSPVPIREGLTRCLTEFLAGRHDFRGINAVSEAKMDRIAGISTPLKEFPSFRQKAKYFLYRYCPRLASFMKKMKDNIRRFSK